MTEILLTPENSNLAAIVQGDPNSIHRTGFEGKIIAPGLMQLQGLLALCGWKPGYVMEASLLRPVVVPSNARYVKNDDQNYSLVDGSITYSTATVREAVMLQKPTFWPAQYDYSLTDEELSPDSLEDWTAYTKVPTCLVRQIIPGTDTPMSPTQLDRIATVGVAANALARALVDNKGLMPGLFIPGLNEDLELNKREYTVLENELHLYMGEPYNGQRISEFKLGVHKPEGLENKEFTVSVSETNGLYTLEFHLRKIRPETLKRILGI